LINNRQNGRRRGRGGGAGGAPRPNGANGGADRGNRIDNRARGNAAQLHEKYKALARDSQMQGDRVTTEYYLQFADHYFRVLAESRSRFEEQQPRPRRDDFMSQNDGDDDYGDEGEMSGNSQDPSQPRDDQQQERAYQPRDDDQRRYGNEGGNSNGNSYNEDNRGDRADRGDRRPPRRDRGNGDGYEAQAPVQRDSAPRDEAAPRGDDRGNRNGGGDRQQRDDRPRRPRRDRDEAYAPAVAAEPVAAPEPAPVLVQEEAPVRARRPRRAAVETPTAEVERIEVDRLPPAFSLTAPPSDVANDADSPVDKPRRRTRRPAADGAVVKS
jgi:hypothetical protein